MRARPPFGRTRALRRLVPPSDGELLFASFGGCAGAVIRQKEQTPRFLVVTFLIRSVRVRLPVNHRLMFSGPRQGIVCVGHAAWESFSHPTAARSVAPGKLAGSPRYPVCLMTNSLFRTPQFSIRASGTHQPELQERYDHRSGCEDVGEFAPARECARPGSERLGHACQR